MEEWKNRPYGEKWIVANDGEGYLIGSTSHPGHEMRIAFHPGTWLVDH
jgi:hypothetical protein